MKNVLIFILLVVLIVCPPSAINREERYKRMHEIKKQMIECILKNEQSHYSIFFRVIRGNQG